MNRNTARTIAWGLAGAILILGTSLGAQTQAQGQVHIRPLLQAEYFNRLIKWDNDAYSSKLNALLFTFNLEVEPLKGLSVYGTLGYSMSNFNGLIFRQLPFSIDLEVGYLNGMLLGGGLKNNFVVSSEFEMELEAQFVTYLGSKGSWLINGLSQSGTLTGKANWYRVQAGPIFWYKGFMYFSPYLRVSFDKLWGTFHMEETIGPLSGLEDKALKASGLFSVAVGTLWEPMSTIGLRGEVYVLPRSKGLDYGAQGKLVFTF